MQKRAWYKKLDKTLLVGSRAQGALLFGILLVLTAVAVSSTPSSETKSESSTTSQAAMFSSIPARQGATSNNNTQINNSRNNRADAASGRDILLSQRAQLGHNPEGDGSDASTSSSTPQSKSATASERSSQTTASAADEIYQNPLEENRRIDAEARRRLREARNNSDSSAESFEEDSNAINGLQNSQLNNQFPGANSLSSAENQGNNSNGTISGISGTNSTKTIELTPAILNTHYCANVSTTTRSPTGTMKIASGFTPKGLLLNTTSGALCGTPNETGIFRFTVEERDLAGAGTNTNYRLVVKDEQTQAGDSEQLASLEITTSSLEVGQVGAEYLQHLEGSGGKTPYSWLATDLPAGLELDQDSGIIAGSPTTAG